MRILTIIYEYPPIGGGGGHVARDILRDLASKDHEIHVLTSHYKNQPRFEIVEGIHIIRVSSARRYPHIADFTTMASFVIAGLWTGLWHIKRWRPDIIHVHFAVPSGPVAWVLSRIFKLPYVLTTHLGDVPGGIPEKTDKWFRWIYPFTPPIWRDASQVIAVSEYTRQLALKNYPVNIKVIPNAISINQNSTGKIKLNSPPLIIFAGRFVPQKNPHQVVRTLSKIQELPWKCIMLGEGPLQPRIMKEIDDADMNDRFVLPGWRTPEEVSELLFQSDILFMPSLVEGMPIVGVKALSAGLAIVASRVDGCIELVEEGKNGFLVDSDDTVGFSTAIQKLLTNPKVLRSYRKASILRSKNFDIQPVAERYEEIFQELLDSSDQKALPFQDENRAPFS